MLRVICYWLFPLLLCTCGPAQDSAGDQGSMEGVRRAEKVFNEAYESLDAAVMERMLSDDFTLRYGGVEGVKTREQFVADVADMRTVLPELTVTTDSLQVSERVDHYEVTSIRSFHWRLRGEPGTYQEHYLNLWRREGSSWKIYRTEIDKPSEGD